MNVTIVGSIIKSPPTTKRSNVIVIVSAETSTLPVSTRANSTPAAVGKIAFPALMLLAALFFLQYTKEIVANFATLGLSATALILLAILLGWALAKLFRFSKAVQRTINIEIGMQNAAQAIAIATSPFIFDNGEMALPAIIYALVMNIVLLAYVALIRARSARG